MHNAHLQSKHKALNIHQLICEQTMDNLLQTVNSIILNAPQMYKYYSKISVQHSIFDQILSNF